MRKSQQPRYGFSNQTQADSQETGEKVKATVDNEPLECACVDAYPVVK